MMMVFVRLLHQYFVFLLISQHLQMNFHKPYDKDAKMYSWSGGVEISTHLLAGSQNVQLIRRCGDCHSFPSWQPFCIHLRVWVVFILEEPTVTVKCRTAIKVMFLCFIVCLCLILDSVSYVHLHPHPFLLINYQNCQ